MSRNQLAVAAGLLAALLVRADDQQTPKPEPADASRLPKGAVARLGSEQFRHGDSVFLVRYALDGKAVLTASRDDTLRLWDAATGKELRRFERPRDKTSLPDLIGPDLLKEFKELGLLDDNGDRALASLLPLFRAAVSPDGRLVSATRGGVVFVWEADTGKLLHEFKDLKGLALDLAFGSDGKSLAAVGSDMAVVTWDVSAGKKLRATEVKGVPSLAKLVSLGSGTPLLTADLGVLAWQHNDDKKNTASLKMYDLKGGKALPAVKLPDGGSEFWTFSPDGKTIAWDDGGAGEITLYDLTKATKKRRRLPSAPDDEVVTGMRFSPDGKRLAVSRMGRGLEVWDAASGKSLWKKPCAAGGVIVDVEGLGTRGDAGAAIAFAPDGKSLAASLGSPRVRIWDEHGKPAQGLDAGHMDAAVVLGACRDGKCVMTFGAGDGVRLWDAATGKGLPTEVAAESAIEAVLSADGRRLAAMDPGSVTLWDVDSGKQLRRVEVGDDAQAVALSADGKRLAVRGDETPEVRLYDAEGGKELLKIQVGPATVEKGGKDPATATGVLIPDVVFSPDGRYLAGGGTHGQLCLWRVADGATVWGAELPAGRQAEKLTFTGHGRGVAVLLDDASAVVYETASGEVRLRLPAPAAKKEPETEASETVAAAVASSADGRLLALSKQSAESAVWDLSGGEEATLLRGHDGPVVGLRFTPDGRLVSGSADTTALVWDVKQLLPEAAPAAHLDGPTANALWADVEGGDATKAFEAMRRLSRSPRQAAALVGEKVRPAGAANAALVARLLAEVEDERFEVRRKATAQLEAMGEAIEGELRAALKSEGLSLDARRRLEALLEKAANDAPSPARVRSLRAVELLEMAGGAEARAALEHLASGVADARLTREAKAALERLPR